MAATYECTRCSPERPVRYFVFPRWELNLVTGSPYNVVKSSVWKNKVVAQTVEVDNIPNTMIQGIYEFSQDWQVQRALFSDNYWDLHQRLEFEGRIKHGQGDCSDRHGPRLVNVWDPRNGWTQWRRQSDASFALSDKTDAKAYP